MISYGGKTFELPKLFSVGPTFAPEGEVSRDSPLDTINTLWDFNRLGDAVRLPVVVGQAGRFLLRNVPTERVLDMPIKFPHTDVRIPYDVSNHYKTIKTMFDYEHSFNPKYDELYAYLTIDRGVVDPGKTQRVPGAHVDGFQGARINPKVLIDHSYVAYSGLPTVWYNQEFKVSHLDPAVHDVFKAFDKQLDETKAVRYHAGQILLFDAYTIHRGDVAAEPISRTFMRLTFSVREFDRLGNTHNPMFDYDWPMVARENTATLIS